MIRALPTRRDTRRLGEAIGRAARPGDVVVLAGELGAGKTFLVRAACRALGVPPAIAVLSPTFALVHDYPGGRAPVVHVDAYRLGGERELDELGLRERLEAGAVLFVEWGEPYVGALGGDALLVRLEAAGGSEGLRRPGSGAAAGERRAALSATGPRAARLLAAVEAG